MRIHTHTNFIKFLFLSYSFIILIILHTVTQNRYTNTMIYHYFQIQNNNTTPK